MGIFGLNIKQLERQRNVEKLIEALEHKKEKVRDKAADALLRLGVPEACKPLIKAWKHGQLGLVSNAVIWATRETQDSEVIEGIIWRTRAVQKHLKGALERNIEWARENNTDITEVIKKDVLSRVQLHNYAFFITALGIIGNIQALDVLIDALKDYYYTIKKRVSTLAMPEAVIIHSGIDIYMDSSIPIAIEESLSKFGKPAAEAIGKIARSKNEGLRQSAHNILNKIKEN